MCGSADVLPVPLLCYYSSQELKDLFALKLQVSVLHQEVALQKVRPSKCAWGAEKGAAVGQ